MSVRSESARPAASVRAETDCALEGRLLAAASTETLNWFIVLPIGELISNDQWGATWASFRDKMRHRYDSFEYFRILKLGKENLHAHIIAKTHDVIDKNDLRTCWKASLKKHAGIDLGNRRVYCQMLYSWKGTAAYLPRIESHLQGEGLPPRGQFHRVIQSSWRFWDI